MKGKYYTLSVKYCGIDPLIILNDIHFVIIVQNIRTRLCLKSIRPITSQNPNFIHKNKPLKQGTLFMVLFLKQNSMMKFHIQKIMYCKISKRTICFDGSIVNPCSLSLLYPCKIWSYDRDREKSIMIEIGYYIFDTISTSVFTISFRAIYASFYKTCKVRYVQYQWRIQFCIL